MGIGVSSGKDMRLGMFALIVMLAAPVAAGAQDHATPERPWWVVPGFDRMPGDGWHRDSLPKIGLPLPPIGLQPRVDPDNHARHRRRTRYAASPVWVVVPQYVIAAPVQPPPAPRPDPAEEMTAQGSLVLRVKPDDTEVFVDGYYVGAAIDLAGDRGGAFLDAGPHRVDLSAPGYEPASFDVKIAPNQSLLLRRELKQIQTAPPPPPAARTPITFYLIPGCYAGNVEPKDAGLPPTCDITRAIVIQNH
jgi:hypothetical protein